MDYISALEYFRDRSDYDRGFVSNPFAGDEAAALGLERTRLLLDAFGSPDRAYPIIHVAGTKGKGSTSAFVESVARTVGRTTGLFATPHLHTIRERIQRNRDPITEAEWAALTDKTASAVSDLEHRRPDVGRITAFEINTAMALLYFAETDVDLGVVEVGLGGRLDATNVVEPDVAVITPVSYDHQAILGDTLEEIASEKAGIIKRGVPVIVGPQEKAAYRAITGIAREVGAPVHAWGSAWHANYERGVSTLFGPWGEIQDVELGLRGQHQAWNAAAALMALWTFDRSIFADLKAVGRGLRDTSWPGRYERVRSDPPVIVDGAHNGASMQVLTTALLDEFESSRFVVVFGSYADKDLDAMLSALKPLEPTIFGTSSGSPRARDSQEIVYLAKSLGFDANEEGSVGRAIQHALSAAGSNTVIVATGSLSIVAKVREYFGLATVPASERAILSG